MSKNAKIASRNNPNTRGKAKEFTYNGRKIKPIKIISTNSTFFGAEYDDNGDLVVNSAGNPIPWSVARA